MFHYNLQQGIFTQRHFDNRYTFTYDESSVALQMPPPYSVVIQVDIFLRLFHLLSLKFRNRRKATSISLSQRKDC
ncbi:hypothetical protein HU200_066169 [Digitaria exilis]|uniref:Uncharacterized protein n=1 Tax=Digitaria exilis TaxID=1010633 RepID=A0A835A6Z6_9POAL|nr:hypothetical protein HU200_066169 [Digitaria exilis]